ncbi:MAG: hypothetical protein WCJ59_00100 [bacterium]
MNDKLKAKLSEEFATLPKALQDVVSGPELPTVIQNITRKFGLLINQSSVLETEIVLVLFGLESYFDLAGNIEREMQIPKDKAEAIAKEADEQIISKVKDLLIESATIEENKLIEEVPIEKNPPIAENIIPIEVIKDQISVPATNIPVNIKIPVTNSWATAKPIINQPIFENTYQNPPLTPTVTPTLTPVTPTGSLLDSRLNKNVTTINTGEGSINLNQEKKPSRDPYREQAI